MVTILFYIIISIIVIELGGHFIYHSQTLNTNPTTTGNDYYPNKRIDYETFNALDLSNQTIYYYKSYYNEDYYKDDGKINWFKILD